MRRRSVQMKKRDAFMKVFADAGGEKSILSTRDIASLVVSGQEKGELLGRHAILGLWTLQLLI